ncbi:MAG: IS4 family transposase [Flavobacteriales bacterium CG_4_8_14_3_um_filter_35_10]|nr:transposase [Zetaproteobacteria bacterium]PIX07384.1 MAG: IS4 family transposase [Flavobacteriales bacterium CG_4_8_14_3_um_filter_35_10]
MLQNKSTTIVSEVKDFFTSSEKAINTILTVLSSLTLSEKQIELRSKSNNEYRNINKFLLIILFPFFDIPDAWHYTRSSLYATFGFGKDVFYRLLNDSLIPWRKISYKISMQLIGKTSSKSNDKENKQQRCLIIDDSDLPKTGRRIELIGRVFSHVSNKSILAFKGLFMGYHDGKSFFALDFSLHGEQGKNHKKPFGLTHKQLKERYSKFRNKNSVAYQRKEEYFTSKIQSMIEMIRTAICNGLRFDYVLVDSWFTCFELVKFIKTRRIGVQLLGMAKMGKTRYFFNGKKLTAKEIVDYQRKTKKLKRSKQLASYYSEVLVNFNEIPVKLFFNKASRKGKWHLMLTTDLELNFEQAYKIYSTRWSIEVFFKEAKQYLGLGKTQSQDFDAQIATTTICMLQYNLLSVARRFTDYESLGELFRNTKAETIQLTVAERIWQIIIDVLATLAELFEIDTEMLMEKLMSDNEKIEKLVNYKTLLQAG